MPADPAEAPDATSVSATWLPGIEALRGIAAGSVVLHHAWALGTSPEFFGSWLIKGFGSWGVDVFFLLSGYLLSEYFWQARRPGSVRAFYIRRVFRIVPAYYANVLILFVLFADHAQLFSRTGAKQVVANATFLFWWRPEYSSSLNVNGVLWTLSLEMTLYLAMPLLAFLVARRPALAVSAMIALGIGWKLVCARFPELIRDWYFGVGGAPEGLVRIFLSRQFLGVLPIFALGIGLRWLVHQGRLPFVTRPVQRLPVLILVVLLVPSMVWAKTVETGLNFEHWRWFLGWDLVLAALAAPALLFASRPIAADRTSLALRVANWFGERSYGIYLWHFPVILSVYGRGVHLAPPDVSYIVPKLLLIFGLTIAFGWASYSLIEKPARELGRRLARKSDA